MEDHIDTIANCAKKFPELRFMQFVNNACVDYWASDKDTLVQLYYYTDRDIAEACKAYCKKEGR